MAEDKKVKTWADANLIEGVEVDDKVLSDFAKEIDDVIDFKTKKEDEAPIGFNKVRRVNLDDYDASKSLAVWGSSVIYLPTDILKYVMASGKSISKFSKAIDVEKKRWYTINGYDGSLSKPYAYSDDQMLPNKIIAYRDKAFGIQIFDIEFEKLSATDGSTLSTIFDRTYAFDSDFISFTINGDFLFDVEKGFRGYGSRVVTLSTKYISDSSGWSDSSWQTMEILIRGEVTRGITDFNADKSIETGYKIKIHEVLINKNTNGTLTTYHLKW